MNTEPQTAATGPASPCHEITIDFTRPGPPLTNGETVAILIGMRDRARAIAALIEDLKAGAVVVSTPLHIATASALLKCAAGQLGLGVRPR